MMQFITVFSWVIDFKVVMGMFHDGESNAGVCKQWNKLFQQGGFSGSTEGRKADDSDMG